MSNQEEKTVRFGYGPMVPPLEEQAKQQGYTLGDKADTLEKIRSAITMVMFHVATDSQVESMRKKLHKKVIKALKPLAEVPGNE